MKKDTVVLTTIGKFKHKVSSVLNGSSEYSGKVRFAFFKLTISINEVKYR